MADRVAAFTPTVEVISIPILLVLRLFELPPSANPAQLNNDRHIFHTSMGSAKAKHIQAWFKCNDGTATLLLPAQTRHIIYHLWYYCSFLQRVPPIRRLRISNASQRHLILSTPVKLPIRSPFTLQRRRRLFPCP
jgi:hypothetical protein